MLDNEGVLYVPSSDPTKDNLKIDISGFLAAEARQEEVAFVTPGKAPELLAFFNKVWRDIHAAVTKLTLEVNKAENEMERRKAVLLLEEVPRILKEKGVANSTDTRKAIIDLDPQYIVLQDSFDQIKAACEYLKGKLKSMENSYSSVKKIMGETDAYNMKNRPNSNLSGGVDRSRPAQATQALISTFTPKPSSGWGKARY